MTAKYFLDTNVLVYAFDCEHPRKQGIAKDYLQRLVTDEHYLISWQVVNEFCQVILRKLTPQISSAKLEEFVNGLPEQRIAPFTKAMITKAIHIQRVAHFAFWDSMILSTAILSGCDMVLTEDLSHGQTIEQITIINPFREDS